MADKESIVIQASNTKALARIINDQHKAGYETNGGPCFDGNYYVVLMSRSTQVDKGAREA